jgi:rare lipoprotein A
VPPAVAAPDVIPRVEPRSRYGNPAYYDVLGKRYYVLSSSVGYWERGVASWYGPGFNKVRTSTGEMYDMYGMTAAHKTLPLPAYVQVTNLQNGRSVIVRVNDRGPFVDNRIIDLSYTAASRLDMLREGTAIVDVRSIDPSFAAPASAAVAAPAPQLAAGASPHAAATPGALSAAPPTANAQSTAAAPPTAAGQATTTVPPNAAGQATAAAPPTGAGQSTTAIPIGAPLFVQAGAFSDPANAERLAKKLRGGRYGTVFVRADQIAGRKMYRVRIGPVPDVHEFDRVVAALEHVGVKDAHLALD